MTHGQKFGISYSVDKEDTYRSDDHRDSVLVVTNPRGKPTGDDHGSNKTRELMEELKLLAHLPDNKVDEDGNQRSQHEKDTN